MQPIGAQELNEGLILQYVLVREDDEMGEKKCRVVHRDRGKI